MLRTLRDILGLVGALRKFQALFWASTLIQLLGQLSLVGLAALSVGVSAHIVSESLAPGFSSALLIALSILLALVLVSASTNLLEAWWAHELAYRILAELRVRIYRALNRIAPRGLAQHRIGDIAARSMGDAEELEWFYAHTAGTAINTIVAPALIITAAAVYGGPVALLAIPALVLVLLVPLLLLNLQRRQGDQIRQRLADIKALAIDGIHGLTELQVLGMSRRHEEHMVALTRRAQRLEMLSQLRHGVERGFNELVVSALTLSVIAILSVQSLTGSYPAERIPMTSVLVAIAAIPAGALVGMLGRFGSMGASAHRIGELLKAPATVPETPLPEAAKPRVSEINDGALAAEQVGFRYSSTQQPVFQGLTLRIAAGERVALFGPSGVGKSTFAFLALRFLDPTSGVMRWQGHDMRSRTPEEHRNQVTLLPQSPYIFAGSVRDNLYLANPEASEEEMLEALCAAGLEQVVLNLGGLDGKVGDRGTTLSGGERQRLGLARVFLRKHRLLVLDEPLANVDPELEKEIATALMRRRGEGSLLLIAHRLSQVEMVDRIVVLSPEGVVDQGSHAELLERCDYYRQLLHEQAGQS